MFVLLCWWRLAGGSSVGLTCSASGCWFVDLYVRFLVGWFLGFDCAVWRLLDFGILLGLLALRDVGVI